MKQPPPPSPRKPPVFPSGARGAASGTAASLLLLFAALTLPADAQQPSSSSPAATGGRNVTVAATTSRAAPPPPLVAAAAVPPANAAGQEGQLTETEIVATDGADFDSKGRIATFTKDVHVTDPRFDLHCDKLTVFLAKATEKGAKGGAAASPGSAPTPPPEATPAGADAPKKDEQQTGGIERAIAEGHVIIVQRRAAESPGGQEKISTGQGEKAVFVTKTGDMTLSGSPRVQQDINEHVATSPGTVMVLGRDNTLRTFGPSKTLIRQRPNENPKAPGDAAPAASPGKKRPGTRRG